MIMNARVTQRVNNSKVEAKVGKVGSSDPSKRSGEARTEIIPYSDRGTHPTHQTPWLLAAAGRSHRRPLSRSRSL